MSLALFRKKRGGLVVGVVGKTSRGHTGEGKVFEATIGRHDSGLSCDSKPAKCHCPGRGMGGLVVPVVGNTSAGSGGGWAGHGQGANVGRG